MLENLVSFAILAGLLTLLPGLDTAQVLRSVAIGGRSTGYATLFGILGGVWIWGVAAALGISALLIASEVAYTIVKWMDESEDWMILAQGLKLLEKLAKIDPTIQPEVRAVARRLQKDARKAVAAKAKKVLSGL